MVVQTNAKFVGAMILSAGLLLSAAASADPPAAVKASAAQPKAVPARVEPAKFYVAMPQPAFTPPSTMDSAWKSVVVAVLASLHHAEELGPASAGATTTVLTRPTLPAVHPTTEVARPGDVSKVVKPKPFVVDPPTTGMSDGHGQGAILPGIEVRMPWHNP